MGVASSQRDPGNDDDHEPCGSLRIDNRTRLERFKMLLKPLEVTVLGPRDLEIHVTVIEDGETPETNAIKKATAHFSRARLTTFATDYALYIVLTELGRQFVHYAMTETVARIDTQAERSRG